MHSNSPTAKTSIYCCLEREWDRESTEWNSTILHPKTKKERKRKMENWVMKLKSEALDDLLAIVQRRGCNICHDQINGPLTSWSSWYNREVNAKLYRW